MKLDQLTDKSLSSPDLQVESRPTLSDNMTSMPIKKSYRIGLAVFDSQIRQRQKLSYFNGNVIDALEKDIWKMQGPSQHKTSKWPYIFKLMKESYVTEFHFQKNPKILKEIQAVTFHELKQLNVFAANIQNYQVFAYLDCPKLQKVNLIYNHCVNFKALSKARMPYVNLICIYIKKASWINEGRQRVVVEHYTIQDFERWGFELNELRLEKSGQDSVMMQDLSRLAKSKQSLENIYVCQGYRILQTEVLKTIKRKGKVKFYKIPDGENQFAEIQL